MNRNWWWFLNGYSNRLAILYKNEGPAVQYKGFLKELNKQMPVIAIPSIMEAIIEFSTERGISVF